MLYCCLHPNSPSINIAVSPPPPDVWGGETRFEVNGGKTTNKASANVRWTAAIVSGLWPPPTPVFDIACPSPSPATRRPTAVSGRPRRCPLSLLRSPKVASGGRGQDPA
ncbi:hypothetical protein AAFF_G00049730 [Aldrovandia affinis]|uniref:Uncharacterized protein n=1 Tax=Aldrovandia affinis TaxID=143900 RepID=A0AAD7WET6_9TELE|nr:hypothetical protein AAFF_G00049730 [Aldrovandia affinis]